jgi:hypothetical protein
MFGWFKRKQPDQDWRKAAQWAARARWINLAKRKEDERYLLAATGDLEGQVKLTVVQLVPLTASQWEVASAKGSAALLAEIDWEKQPKTFGWSAMRA